MTYTTLTFPVFCNGNLIALISRQMV